MLRKIFIPIAVVVLLACVFYFAWLYPRYTVPILMYHQFGYKEQNIFVTPENFTRQLTYIKNKGYKVISLDELAEGIRNRKKFAHNTVVITIDDGFLDNFTYAYPILSTYGFPATMFIIADYIDNDKEFMTWSQIKLMQRDNISFGAHARHNVYLPSIEDKEALGDEIVGSKLIIESKTGEPVDYLAYPVGGFTDEIKEITKSAGYKGACTTNRGMVSLNKDVYELKRVKITNSDTNKPFSFWAKLSGYYNIFRNKKAGHEDN